MFGIKRNPENRLDDELSSETRANIAAWLWAIPETSDSSDSNQDKEMSSEGSANIVGGRGLSQSIFGHRS